MNLNVKRVSAADKVAGPSCKLGVNTGDDLTH